jgi:AbrB family looped-hinge helix DNA binding protein
MPTATLTERGQVVIPAEIRARHGLTPGTQIEFVDGDDGIKLVVRRRITPSDPASGYGLIKVPPLAGGRSRRLGDFDPATTLARVRPARR